MFAMRFFFATTALCVLHASTSAFSLATTPHTTRYETVKTGNGLITGHRSPQVDTVWEYLGIPYAQPPVGDLRFAWPQKYRGNASALYVASDFVTSWARLDANYGDLTMIYSDCPQQAATQPDFPGFTAQAKRILSYFTAAAGTRRSEDCLTLNIWTRETWETLENGTKKPVFVLFHGGRFAGGNTNTPFASGQYLAAAEDIIVVSVNYRLNVFGFPGAPAADTNLGLRDQRLAVEWLQHNVAAFGGDAKKIVIAGQSSGGAAVDWWAYAYKHNPIVHGLMSTSGNAFSFPMNPAQRQRANWYNISSLLGCGGDSGGDDTTLHCMRQKPWTAVSEAVGKIAASPGGSPVRSTPPFYPLVDNETIFADYISRAESGDFAKLPYFHGHNDNEQGYYVIPAFAQGRNVTKQQADQFLLESFVCPVSFSARARVNASVPTWVYRYFGAWDNTRLYPTSGAYHGSELHMILGGAEDASGLPGSRAQKETVRLMQRAVAVFAENPENGLKKLGWPEFQPGMESWGEIARKNEPVVTFARPEKYDGICEDVVLGAFSGMS